MTAAAFTAAGFGLNLFSALRQNDALEAQARSVAQAAQLSQQRINQQISQSRVRSIFATSSLARSVMQAAALNNLALPEGVSGRELAAQTVELGAQDTAVLQQQQEAGEQAAAAQKENIVATARSQINQIISQAEIPLLSAIQGGLQGLQTGLSIETGLLQLDQLKKQKSHFTDIAGMEKTFGTLRLATKQMGFLDALARLGGANAHADDWWQRVSLGSGIIFRALHAGP